MSKAGELKACEVVCCSFYSTGYIRNCRKCVGPLETYDENIKYADKCEHRKHWNRPIETALQERAENAEYNFGVQLDETKALQEQLKQAEERVRELEGLVKKYKLAVDAQKDVIKALQGKE